LGSSSAGNSSEMQSGGLPIQNGSGGNAPRLSALQQLRFRREFPLRSLPSANFIQLSASSHVPQQSVELEHELAAHRSVLLSAAVAPYGLVGNLAR
jgi:hypothetical protein